MAAPKKVLFLCVKNTSRSVMAEALANVHAKGWEAQSAGVNPGKEANPQAVRALREVGCDVSGHRPKHLSVFQEVTFDLVVKMDVPDVADFVSAKWIENWDIPDPANGGIEEFRKVRDLILDHLRKAMRDPEGEAVSRAA